MFRVLLFDRSSLTHNTDINAFIIILCLCFQLASLFHSFNLHLFPTQLSNQFESANLKELYDPSLHNNLVVFWVNDSQYFGKHPIVSGLLIVQIKHCCKKCSSLFNVEPAIFLLIKFVKEFTDVLFAVVYSLDLSQLNAVPKVVKNDCK